MLCLLTQDLLSAFKLMTVLSVRAVKQKRNDFLKSTYNVILLLADRVIRDIDQYQISTSHMLDLLYSLSTNCCKTIDTIAINQ